MTSGRGLQTDNDNGRSHTRFPQTRAYGILAALAAFWLAADIAYYFGLPAFGRSPNYNEDPIAISIFYLFWVGLVVIAFWPLYATWPRVAPWPVFRSRLTAALIWCVMFAGGLAYVSIALPSMSPAFWPEVFGPAPDLIVASEFYFLPKSIEILFQQLLVLALVLALSRQGVRLWQISVLCAALFGAMHVLLILTEMPLGGVLRFTLFATAFGLLMPALFLRVPYGIAVSYGLHWLYYAATIYMARTFGPQNWSDLIPAG
jgi:hypothetical protein